MFEIGIETNWNYYRIVLGLVLFVVGAKVHLSVIEDGSLSFKQFIISSDRVLEFSRKIFPIYRIQSDTKYNAATYIADRVALFFLIILAIIVVDGIVDFSPEYNGLGDYLAKRHSTDQISYNAVKEAVDQIARYLYIILYVLIGIIGLLLYNFNGTHQPKEQLRSKSQPKLDEVDDNHSTPVLQEKAKIMKKTDNPLGYSHARDVLEQLKQKVEDCGGFDKLDLDEMTASYRDAMIQVNPSASILFPKKKEEPPQ